MLFNLAEAAKANGISTYKCFELLLTKIPKHMDDTNLDFIEKLLPWSDYVKKRMSK